MSPPQPESPPSTPSRAPSAGPRAGRSSAALARMPTGGHRAVRPRRARGRRRGPPSPALIFVPPLVLCAGVVGVAALHNALGLPLGAAWAAEVWGLAKTAITATLAITGAGAYMHRNNRAAWALSEAYDDDDGDGNDRPPSAPAATPGQAPTAGGPPPPALPPQARQQTARTNRPPPATESVRARRTGRLTPVVGLIDDGPPPGPTPAADDVGGGAGDERHAGGRGGSR